MTPLRSVELRPSRALAAAIAAGHLAALAAVWAALPGPGAAVATAGLALSMAAFVRARREQPAALEFGGVSLRIVDRHGETRDVRLLDARVPAWWLIVLEVGAPGARRQALVVLPDSGRRDDLRALRAWILRGAAWAGRGADALATGDDPART
ncbi:MAG: hypothetical protein N2544_16485 [Burkholderiales bacterium]|nr:hypothetical protein [Burkholderiales bacterium]